MSRMAAVLLAIVLSATALAQQALPAKTMGEGDTQMILIPGLAADWRVWEDFMQRNQDAYTMHAVTLPGFGPMEAPEVEGDGTPLIDNAVAGVAALMKEKEIEEAVVMGHGALGSFIALRAALDHPERVSKAIAVDGFLPSMPIGGSGITSGPQRDGTARQLSAIIRDAFPEEQWDMMLSGEQQSITEEGRQDLAEIYEGADFEIGTQYLAEMILMDLARGLKENEVPILAIYAVTDDGGADTTSQVSMSKQQSRSIIRDSFRASTSIFTNSRPWLMRDRPEQFDETIRTFLRGLPVTDVVLSAPEADGE